jgi:uridine kinase
MDLIGALLDLCSAKPQPIIAIDGPAGAGKTTLAREIVGLLSRSYSATIVHMDDLYDGWENALTSTLTSTLTEISSSHKGKKPISFSTFNWKTESFNPPTVTQSTELLILEGVGSGQRAIRESLSALIWIDIEVKAGLDRVLLRDGYEFEKEMKKWLTTQEQHFLIEATKNAADFILTT